jgi:hypothetical protein
MEPFEFDQSDLGWRSFKDIYDRIFIIESYLNENVINGEWVEKYAHSPLKPYPVRFHLAQNYLKAGLLNKAHSILLQSYSHSDTIWDNSV